MIPVIAIVVIDIVVGPNHPGDVRNLNVLFFGIIWNDFPIHLIIIIIVIDLRGVISTHRASPGKRDGVCDLQVSQK
jgi:hypothetical protein